MMIGLTCEMVDAGRNVPHLCNKEFSALVQKANIVTDPKQRAKLYYDAQQVFYDQVPGINFADAKAYVGVRDNVQGFKLHFFGGQPFGGVSLKK
jgi:dipeptide transport system substrate-binding protein